MFRKLMNKSLFKMMLETSHRTAVTANVTSAKCQSKQTEETYDNAIITLNSLQSNLSTIRSSTTKVHDAASIHIQETSKFLARIGVTLNDLDKLPVIHVSGTKGKGSTCSLIESILRKHGYRTGFFSSPHLVAVRERIRLNGLPINEKDFSKYFWYTYNNLSRKQEYNKDMPAFFNFLTVMAFDVFLRENVDVAIIEVGIGGEYDCTNVVRNTKTVGITSLGLEHTNILGNSLSDIAWQKAGIIKSNSEVFTVQQPDECMHVIRERCREKNSTLHIVPDYNTYQWEHLPSLRINNAAQQMNTSLAIQISFDWMKKQIKSSDKLSKVVTSGIESNFWPGRCHLITFRNKRFFLDGAHTFESMNICAEWFSVNVKSENPKILIFNTIGDRSSSTLLNVLKGSIDFDMAFFVPNIASESNNSNDSINYNFPNDEQHKRCAENAEIWKQLPGRASQKDHRVQTFTSVENVIKYLENNFTESQEIDILVTGSLHLIGAVLVELKAEIV